jgi:hypothetical protein
MGADARAKAVALDRASFLAGVDPARRDEAERLLAIFAEVTGWQARLWGPAMVGFGRYAYRYASGQSGESFATGFSPRKAELSIYLMSQTDALLPLLARLGPHRMGKACLYLRRLDGVDEAVLRALIRAGLDDLARHWPLEPV